MDNNELGTVYTFYSYKGGVGRSMALANVGALLASWGKRVLLVDFDIEAPGLERYFQAVGINGENESCMGIVDLIHAFANGYPLKWQDCLLETKPLLGSNSLSILTAGQNRPNYTENVQAINWNVLFDEQDLGEYLYELREEWKAEYDYILVDSRTGISDIGGICTIILPDALVLFFTANIQSIQGVGDVARRARDGQELIAEERERLISIPILSRDHRKEEYSLSDEWRSYAANELRDLYEDWVWDGITAEKVVRKLYLPQVPMWSYGERLPVIEHPEELEDPASLGAAFGKIATLLSNGADWSALESLSSPHELFQTRANEARLNVEIEHSRSELERQKEEIESLHESQTGFIMVGGAKYLKLFAIALITIFLTIGWGYYQEKEKTFKLTTDRFVYDARNTLLPLDYRLKSFGEATARGHSFYSGINFRDQKLSYDFSSLDLSNADFSGSALNNSKFNNTTLNHAKFDGVNAANISFEGAWFYATSFIAADLRGANFDKVKVISSKAKVDLRGADLRGALYDKNSAFNNAFIDEFTLAKDAVLSKKEEKIWQLERYRVYQKVGMVKYLEKPYVSGEPDNAQKGTPRFTPPLLDKTNKSSTKK